MSRWSEEISGPISVASSSGSPTRSDFTADSSCAMNSSSAGRCTEDPRARTTVLTRVAEHGERRRLCRGGEIGVGEDQVGGLAAELERYSLDRFGGELSNPPSHRGRAGKGNLGHVGVLDQSLADDPSGAHHDVQNALGKARFKRQLLELECGQRRQLRGLENNGIPRRECRRDLPRGDRQRKVPRDDQSDHPERLAKRHVDAGGHRNRRAQQALRRTRVVVERVDDHCHLAAGVADGLTHVA